VSFVLRVGASATVTLPSGGRFIVWHRVALHSWLDQHPELEQAFMALVARDLAGKVANGHVL
jgi:hypothetical protein